MGKSSSNLISELGKPARIDPSLYGFDWWIYSINYDKYIQAGIKDDVIVTIFATGTDIQIPPFKIGQSVAELYTSTVFDTNINLEYKNSSYKFELSEDDLNTRPLIMIGNVYAQLYLDKFSSTLSSIRLIDTETLIKQHPYEMVYRGELPEGFQESNINEEAVERGKERQIFDITNVFRVRNELEPLEWDEETAKVALAHSKDMYESQQFSHISDEFGDLTDRLEAGNVFYQIAGENIAANYLDGPAAVEGWLNSKGHRESLLNAQFTHLGVGVYKKHYTQNFIEKWQE
ncbi:CAP domain-containing protein [Bacillus sp. FJAT-29937]|uniref:CAP domain-containing protein n=1 Tax=Bacillus sp. FJAT-29937 TaxID=1720553 RepID=UPI001E364041|nr:CAP domain-containing protein [Bacillus sp. FJAT-29937]